MLRSRHQAIQLNVLSVEQPAQEDHLALGFQHEQLVGMLITRRSRIFQPVFSIEE